MSYFNGTKVYLFNTRVGNLVSGGGSVEPEPEEVIEQLNTPTIVFEDDVLKISNVDDRAECLVIYRDGEQIAVIPTVGLVVDISSFLYNSHFGVRFRVSARAYWYAESERSNEVLCFCHDSVVELLYALSDDGTYYICRGFDDSTDSLVLIVDSYNGLEVKEIGARAFSGMTQIEGVNIPDTVESIGDEAFARCSNLTNLYIGGGVNEIGVDAFSGCDRLYHIHYGGSVREWNYIETIGDGNFRDNIRHATIHCNDGDIIYGGEEDATATEGLCYSLSDDGAYMICDGFGDNESVADVVIASTYAETEVKVIGFEAFCGNEIITSVHIPNTVEIIYAAAFGGCPNLASVKMSNSVRKIAEDAFASSNNLTDIYYAGTEAEWNAIETIYLGGVDFKDYLANATIHFNYVDAPEIECEVYDNTLHLSFPSATVDIENDILCVEGSAISANIENDILYIAVD